MLTQRRQGCLHFIAGVKIRCLLRRRDSGRQSLASLRSAPQAGQELPELEVSRYISRMVRQKAAEVLDGSSVVAQPGTFERQAIPRKSVAWIRPDEALENLPARLLCLGHNRNCVL